MILVVDDDENIRIPFVQLLQSHGYEVAGMENGRAALDFLESGEELPSLIFLDLMMPVMNGIELLGKLQNSEKLKDVPVIVLTAYGERTGNLRANEVYDKPFRFSDMLTVANRYCSKTV